jgi:hypothetical protein
MELVVFIERSVVLILSIFSIPGQTTVLSNPIDIGAFESMILPSLDTFSVELIVSEAPFVGNLFILVDTVFGLGHIAMEVALVVRSIGKDESTVAFSLSVIEVADIETTIFLKHSTKAVRASALLNHNGVTLSSYPTYVSDP